MSLTQSGGLLLWTFLDILLQNRTRILLRDNVNELILYVYWKTLMLCHLNIKAQETIVHSNASFSSRFSQFT